jgi:hypothetical protein
MLTCLAAILAAAMLTASASGQDGDAPAPAPADTQVMVLGTIHFDGGGGDYVNPEVDDFLSAPRQAEIAGILDRLEAFQPDRIIVELEPEHEGWINERYRAWRAGEAELTVNERDQIGLRLAARLGHDQVWAVDYQNGMDFEAMLGAAQAAGQTRLLDAFQQTIGEVETFFARNADGSVRDRLIDANSPEAMDFHRMYLWLAQAGTVDDPVGAHQMTAWWGRNMVIFARIAQIAQPGERILVVYGAGHKYLLDQYFDEAPGFAVIDPLDYLQ